MDRVYLLDLPNELLCIIAEKVENPLLTLVCKRLYDISKISLPKIKYDSFWYGVCYQNLLDYDWHFRDQKNPYCINTAHREIITKTENYRWMVRHLAEEGFLCPIEKLLITPERIDQFIFRKHKFIRNYISLMNTNKHGYNHIIAYIGRCCQFLFEHDARNDVFYYYRCSDIIQKAHELWDEKLAKGKTFDTSKMCGYYEDCTWTKGDNRCSCDNMKFYYVNEYLFDSLILNNDTCFGGPKPR